MTSTSIAASRADRSRAVKALKARVSAIGEVLPYFRLVQDLEGANESAHYSAIVAYPSSVVDEEERIKIEVGLREPLVEPAIYGTARTLLLDPVSGDQAIPGTTVLSLSRREAMAEKFRAALTRREVAIRDFYDIYHAVDRLGFFPGDREFVELVGRKLSTPWNPPPDVSEARLSALRTQIATQLRPVLRRDDFAAFDFDRAVAIVRRMAADIV